MKNILLTGIALLTFTVAAAQKTGYLNLTTFGILAGTSSDNRPAPLSVLSEHHYRINNTWAPGMTLGIEQLNENTLPLAANLKLFLPAGNWDFFLAGMGGYAISLEKPTDVGVEKARGGPAAGIEIGMFIPVNSGASVVLAMGYRYTALNYDLKDWWIGSYERKVTYNRFSVRIGIALY